MRIEEAFGIERLDNDNERAYKILDACFVDVETYAGQFYFANASKTKKKSILDLSTLTNPFVRCFQKTTHYVDPETGSIHKIENHDTGTSKAADKGHALHKREDKSELAAQFVNNAWPSEQAMIASVAAHDVEDLDLESAFGDEFGEAFDLILRGLYKLANSMFEVDVKELPEAHKKSETQKTNYIPAETMEANLREAMKRKRDKLGDGDEQVKSPSGSATAQAQIDELCQIPYIGSATARAIVDNGKTWATLKRQAEANGSESAISEIADLLNKRQRENLIDALPTQI